MADFFCSAVLYCAVLYSTVLCCTLLSCSMCTFRAANRLFPARNPDFPARKKRRAARKDLSGQIAVFPVSDRANSHLTGRRILFPLRQTHHSVCHAEGKSPLTHSADTEKIDLKRSSGTNFSKIFAETSSPPLDLERTPSCTVDTEQEGDRVMNKPYIIDDLGGRPHRLRDDRTAAERRRILHLARRSRRAARVSGRVTAQLEMAQKHGENAV